MQPLNVAIVAVEDFSPFHFSVPCIIFSDKMAVKKRFEVQMCGEKPGIISSQDGFSITATHGYEAVEAADIVVIPWWGTTAHRPPQSLLGALNRARQNGAQIVGLCLGAFVLGYAGLLDGKRAATHWEFEQDFQARFPADHLDINALYERAISLTGVPKPIEFTDKIVGVIRYRDGSVIDTVRQVKEEV